MVLFESWSLAVLTNCTLVGNAVSLVRLFFKSKVVLNTDIMLYKSMQPHLGWVLD